MKLVKYPTAEAVQSAISAHEPLTVLVAFDGSEALVGPIDEVMEHYILLMKLNRDPADLDRYFRIVLDEDGADWTFVCPAEYKSIPDKQHRIQEFYKDGFSTIPEAIKSLGFLVGIDIPKRYRRHFDLMSNDR